LVLVDTVGELAAVWGLACIAFVGGSLDGKRGGQNLIEPAAYGAAVVVGPHTWNFRDVVTRFTQAGALRVVHTGDELTATLSRWLADPIERLRIAETARQLVLSGQGATERTLAILQAFLPETMARQVA
jgi:3-deoxy-D-manno-octulosonic-acid transferase